MFGNLFNNIKKVIDENMDKSPEELDKMFFDENGKPNEELFGNAFEKIKAEISNLNITYEPTDFSDLNKMSDDDIYDTLPMILFDDDNLNDEKKIAHIVFEFEAEYSNGGVSQYFANTRGEHISELVNALETVDALKYAKACDDFINKYDIKSDDFDDSIENYFEVAEKMYPYSELEALIDEIYITDSLQDYLIKYIRENIGEINSVKD